MKERWLAGAKASARRAAWLAATAAASSAASSAPASAISPATALAATSGTMPRRRAISSSRASLPSVFRASARFSVAVFGTASVPSASAFFRFAFTLTTLAPGCFGVFAFAFLPLMRCDVSDVLRMSFLIERDIFFSRTPPRRPMVRGGVLDAATSARTEVVASTA